MTFMELGQYDLLSVLTFLLQYLWKLCFSEPLGQTNVCACSESNTLSNNFKIRTADVVFNVNWWKHEEFLFQERTSHSGRMGKVWHGLSNHSL